MFQELFVLERDFVVRTSVAIVCFAWDAVVGAGVALVSVEAGSFARSSVVVVDVVRTFVARSFAERLSVVAVSVSDVSIASVIAAIACIPGVDVLAVCVEGDLSCEN